MFFKRKDCGHHMYTEIKAVKNLTSEKGKREIDRLRKARMFTPQLLWKNLNNNDTTKSLSIHNVFFYIFLLFPVSVKCVERLLRWSWLKY